MRRLVRESTAIGRQEDGRCHSLYFGGPLCKSLDEIRVESVEETQSDVACISAFKGAYVCWRATAASDASSTCDV